MNIELLKYPIGEFETPKNIASQDVTLWINEIETLPNRLSNIVINLTEEELNTPYRPNGWMVRQVIHHLADSHLNAYTRFHLALTENNPTIKPYAEAAWAELNYLKHTPISISLNLITSTHARLVLLLKSLSSADLEKTYTHPQYNKEFKLNQVIALYAWHGKHHVAHISQLIKRNFDNNKL